MFDDEDYSYYITSDIIVKDEYKVIDNDGSKGNFYIELQDHGIAAQKKIIPDLIKLARECDLECVATNDVHYIDKEDARVLRLL